LERSARKHGPDVWIYRWRERLANGTTVRRGETVGSVEQFPTRAQALKASQSLRIAANVELPQRHSTRLAYLSYLGQHIKPKWSGYPLAKLTAAGAALAIEQWLKDLPLAPKTKGNIRNTMAVIFNCGMRWGVVPPGCNPMALVRVKGVSRRLTEPRVITAPEFRALVQELPGEPYRTMVTLAIATGLRCSELLALQWSDVDWANLTLLVRRAIVDGVVDDVKTK
jgi:integrase